MTRPVPVWARWFAILGLVVAAFSAGKFSGPRDVETETVEHTVYRDRVVTKTVEVKAAAKVETRIVYRDRVITKDGTVTEHEIEKTGTVEQTRDATATAKVEQTDATRDAATKTVATTQPDWRVHVQAGASLVKPLVPLYGPLVVGVQVDRRILGGVSAGVWASSVGAAGLSISAEF